MKSELGFLHQGRDVKRLAFAIFGLLLSVYLLTMGGHTGSSDEETMFYVADSIVTTSNFAVPVSSSGTVASLRSGTDGYFYSPYGITPSAMLVPFVALGHAVADWALPQYRPFITRLTASTLDPILSALTGVVLFLFGLRLGFSARLSTVLALIFGLTTIAWPYSKYLWSEPVTSFWLLLSVFLMVVGAQKRSLFWALCAGICFGLSVGSKISTIVALVGLFSYYAFYLVEEFRNKRNIGKPLVQPLFFVGGFIVVFCLIGIYNFMRFGNAADTGYGQLPFDLLAYGGIQGLLLSPGKSILLYSPVSILTLPALVMFARRHLKVAVCFFLIIITQILLYGSFRDWHGDAAWGPRYLVPITPLLVLPLGSLLAGVRLFWSRLLIYSLFVFMAVVGIFVQIGGVLVNYDTYTIVTGGTYGDMADRRRNDPLMSPILQHWNLLLQRYEVWNEYFTDGVELVDGLYAAEGPKGSLFPRWTNGSAVFVIRSGVTVPNEVNIEYIDRRPIELGPTNIGLFVNGRSIPESLVHRSKGENVNTNNLNVLLSTDLLTPGKTVFTIASNTWSPSKVSNSTDLRELGISIRDLQIKQNGELLHIRENPVKPFPSSQSSPWSREAFAWFYDPDNTHLADVWEWYLYFSGLPRNLVIIAILPAIGAVLSSWLLIVSWRASGRMVIVPPVSVPILVSAEQDDSTS